GVRDQVERMIADPRSTELFWRFLSQYMRFELISGLSKDGDLYGEFDDEVKGLLEEEARQFINHVVADGTGSLTELFTAEYTFANEALADFYGLDGASGEGFEMVSVDANERAGLLTHGGFLAVLGNEVSSSPTLRGHFVRTKLLCNEIPDPPDNVNDVIEPPSDVETTRERYQAHLTRQDCVGCHTLMDPIGFGFEHFDAAGRYRTEENGEPIDASGVITGLDGQDVEFEGPRELVEAILASPELGACVTKHFFRYAMGRLEAPFDECELGRMEEQFETSGGSLPDLLTAVIDSSAFQFRVKE